VVINASLSIAPISRNDRPVDVERRDRVAVVALGVGVHEYHRHRGMASPVERLSAALVGIEVRADPSTEVIVERDHGVL